MRRFTSRLRRSLALAAAFVTGLAPVLAYAHPTIAARGDYAEICTEAGLEQVPADGGGTPLAHLAHCVLCLAPGGVFAPGRAAPLLAAIGRVERPVRTTAHAPTPVEPVRAARPRGPPARPATSV
jgi:hypothetical protein